MLATRYFLDYDWDQNYYLVPVEHKKDWCEWVLEAAKDDIGSFLSVPHYAKPLNCNCHEVEFEAPTLPQD